MSHEDWSVDVGRVSVREAEARRGQSCEGAGVPRGSRKQNTEQQAHVREKPSANVDLNQGRTF